MIKSGVGRMLLGWILCSLLHATPAWAQMNATTEATHIARIKKTLTESKNSPNSRVEVRLKGRGEVTGSVNELKDNEFILNEMHSGAELMIAYQDVTDVKRRGPSTFAKVGIAALVGGTTILTVVAIVASATGR